MQPVGCVNLSFSYSGFFYNDRLKIDKDLADFDL